MSKLLASEKGEVPKVSWANSRYSLLMLGLISYVESIFAPILIDPFLVALVMANRKRWKAYVLTAIAASVLGGVTAYFLGLLFFDTFGLALIATFGVEAEFREIAATFDQNGFVFVFIGAFTPVPYKLVALASGILHISFITFLVASIVGRVLRLGLVGVGAYALSPKSLPIMQRNHYLVALVLGCILVTYISIKLFV